MRINSLRQEACRQANQTALRRAKQADGAQKPTLGLGRSFAPLGEMSIQRIAANYEQGLPPGVVGGPQGQDNSTIAQLIRRLQQLMGLEPTGQWDAATQDAYSAQTSGGGSGLQGSEGGPRAEDIQLAIAMLMNGGRTPANDMGGGGGSSGFGRAASRMAPMFGAGGSGVSAAGAKDSRYFSRKLQGAASGVRASGATDLPAASGSYREQAAGLIKQFEGFRSKPYWDVNAYRVGYGTDTINGQRVTPGMRVTREQATTSLINDQIPKFESTIRGQVGNAAFDRLPDNTKASLISVAYNYGSLPSSVRNAVKTGNVGSIASSISGLSHHNGGINAGRRQAEATYASRPPASTRADATQTASASASTTSKDKDSATT